MSDSKKIGIFFVFVFVLYSNSIPGEFVFDDEFLLKNNVYLNSIHDFISYFTSGTSDFGRPVRFASFYLDTLVFGKSTIGYHISNILYYFLFCTLAYFFSKRMFEDSRFAFVVALIFIAHPLHSEGVAYISGRKDVLAGIFSFASLICFDSFLSTRERTTALWTIFFFLLAIGTKETHAILPILYALMQIFRNQSFRFQKQFYILLILVAGMFLLMVIFIRNRVFFDYLNTIPIYGNNQGINFATAAKICAIILSLAFFPFGLSADYSFNVVKRIELVSVESLMVILGACVYVFLMFYAFRRDKRIAFGLTWAAICLAPICHFIPYPEVISERSIIFLSYGVCVILAALILKLPSRQAAVIMVLLISIFSVCTIMRNPVWRNEFTLWQSVVHRYPECARARYNLGIEYVQKKQFQEAENEFQASLRINPPELITVPDYSIDALLNLGNAYALQGDLAKAKEYYQAVLSCDRHHPLALKNLQIVGRSMKP